MPLLVLSLLLVALLAALAGWWLGRTQGQRHGSHTDQKLALHHPTTGLPNQTAVLEALTRTLSLADRLHHPVTVLMVEIDGFAELQTQFGPREVTALEQAVAERLSERVRTHDLLGHWGPGQFLAVLPDADVASALVLAEDMRQLVAHQPLDPIPGAPRITVSVGLHGRTPTSHEPLRDLSVDMVVGAQRALEATTIDGPNRLEIEP